MLYYNLYTYKIIFNWKEIIMSNVKKNINAKNEESKRIPLEEEVIKNFVNQCEAIYEDNKIPVTIRLETSSLALLDHLVKRWKSNRSYIAAKLLEEMIWLVFRRVYEDKTSEELQQLHRKIIDEFYEKQKKRKMRK